MANAIKNLGQFIIDGIANILKTLFIPDENFFSDKIEPLKAKLDSKLPFINDFRNYLELMTNNIKSFSVSNAPTFEFIYKGTTYNIFDFSVFGQYRSVVHSIISFCAYFFFFRKYLKRLPLLIGGI